MHIEYITGKNTLGYTEDRLRKKCRIIVKENKVIHNNFYRSLNIKDKLDALSNFISEKTFLITNSHREALLVNKLLAESFFPEEDLYQPVENDFLFSCLKTLDNEQYMDTVDWYNMIQYYKNTGNEWIESFINDTFSECEFSSIDQFIATIHDLKKTGIFIDDELIFDSFEKSFYLDQQCIQSVLQRDQSIYEILLEQYARKRETTVEEETSALPCMTQ